MCQWPFTTYFDVAVALSDTVIDKEMAASAVRREWACVCRVTYPTPPVPIVWACEAIFGSWRRCFGRRGPWSFGHWPFRGLRRRWWFLRRLPCWRRGFGRVPCRRRWQHACERSRSRRRGPIPRWHNQACWWPFGLAFGMQLTIIVMYALRCLGFRRRWPWSCWGRWPGVTLRYAHQCRL